MGGEYALLLADDDWLNASFECSLTMLRTRPDHALVGGVPRLLRRRDGRYTKSNQTNLRRRIAARHRRLPAASTTNGIFYGLARTS